MRISARKGFTLLELLVAIAIFSLIGLGANQVLRSVMESNDRVRAGAAGYTGLNLAFSLLGRDFNQFVPRRVRDGYGEPLGALVFEGGDYAVEFTRGGWTNPGGRRRSKLHRVAYVLDEEEKLLRRLFWTVLDRAEDSEPVGRVILEGVTDLRITGIFPEDGEATLEQEALEDETADSFPVAVEVAINTELFGELVRVFQLVDTFEPGFQAYPDQGEGDEALPAGN